MLHDEHYMSIVSKNWPFCSLTLPSSPFKASCSSLLFRSQTPPGKKQYVALSIVHGDGLICAKQSTDYSSKKCKAGFCLGFLLGNTNICLSPLPRLYSLHLQYKSLFYLVEKIFSGLRRYYIETTRKGEG